MTRDQSLFSCLNRLILLFLACLTGIAFAEPAAPEPNLVVAPADMEKIYQKIKTPFKYGVVLKHPDADKKVDCPTIFRQGDRWYMSYIVFDGQGYETWLAESSNLLQWQTLGKILPFTPDTWDANQKGGYVALVDIDWGGSYQADKFLDKYWLSYIGGATIGYEAGTLGIGIAHSSTLTESKPWQCGSKPVFMPSDKDARWFENVTIYKSLIVRDKQKHTGHPFVMYYNAKGEGQFESIGMAVSDDMVTWKRFGADPVITRRKGICGDAQIARIGDIYVMFYFGAFWKPGAFERFACSRDLIHWTDWTGPDLIAPSQEYDKEYAHKPWVLKWNGVVYHFYNAVGAQGRVIALATSKELKQSVPQP